ncbi:MAG TPA: gluconeogenesis factor YvcK family protein, partial [Patescibacteria group bacterium]|nr:gluconeogenesis factor YvcK family protein [Patescibacteria group bacterium]
MKRIVVIGGGTGTYTVLSGLKEYPVHLSAVVAMSDNGGSTGVLRDELGVLPPGDIRRSLIALSESPQIIRDLFNYRFESGGLEGHSFGNLFLTALEKVTGNFEEAVKEAGKILSIRGDVIPATLHNTHLYAKLEDGTVIEGETNIDIPKHDGRLRIKDVALKPKARVTKSARTAIQEADLIVLSPGDLFTSLIPNLLILGIPEAIRASKAKVVYCCNLTTKHGETNGFTVDDFVSTIER